MGVRYDGEENQIIKELVKMENRDSGRNMVSKDRKPEGNREVDI